MGGVWGAAVLRPYMIRGGAETVKAAPGAPHSILFGAEGDDGVDGGGAVGWDVAGEECGHG